MMIYNNTVLIYLYKTIVNLTNTNTTYIFIIIDGADQNLSRCLWITFRCRNMLNNGFKQWNHILSRII